MASVINISESFGAHNETTNPQGKDFFDSWSYVTTVLKMYDEAKYYRIRETSEKYKNGSPVFLCYFLNEAKDKLISTHKAMKLYSKKSKSDYFVVMKNPHRKKFTPEEEQSVDEALDKLLL